MSVLFPLQPLPEVNWAAEWAKCGFLDGSFSIWRFVALTSFVVLHSPNWCIKNTIYRTGI